MPRLTRITIAGQPYHVIQRGNNGGDIFFDEEDYEIYLDLLAEYAPCCGCAIHAYVLMTNHVHILLTPAKGNGISVLMQDVGRRYVHHINKKYARTGTLWEGRFRSSPIDAEEYLFICMRYIELNPVRAKMVRKPEKYEWSSYRHNALGEDNKLINAHSHYESLGRSRRTQSGAYQSLFAQAISQDDLDHLREAVRGGWATGGEKFCAALAQKGGRRVAPRPRGGDHRSEKFRHNASD